MSYLLDKSRKRKKFFKIALGVVVLVILLYFRSSIFTKLSFVGHTVFRPVLILGNKVDEKLKTVNSFFASKNSLYKENLDLKSKIDEDRSNRANYDSVVLENVELKNTLGRKEEQAHMILAAILGKPNQSPYDTLIVDAGVKENIKEGDVVFAFGDVPIGRVAEVYSNSSKVILFSNNGEKTQVVITLGLSQAGEANKAVFMELIGRGGGNFEMILPQELTPVKGDQVVLPGITPHVVGIVETIISDPRDPFQKALLIAPVNIQELKFVEVLVN